MKNSDTAFLFLLLLSPLIVFAIHLIVGRLHHALQKDASPLMGVIWSIGIGFIVLAIVFSHYWPAFQNGWEAFWACVYGIIVFLGFSVSYFILFAMTEAARRIRIMQDLYELRKTTLQEIERRYGAHGMLSARLERMVALGQLTRRGGRYYSSGRLLRAIGRIIMFWSWLLKFS